MNTKNIKGTNLLAAGKYYLSNENEDFPTVFIDFAKKTYSDMATGESGKLEKKEEIIKEDYNEDQLRMISLNEKALEFFKANIKNAEEYLKKRSLTLDEAEKYGLGATSKGLYRFLIKSGFKRDEILKSGLFKERDKSLSDTFWDRLMFPIRDREGYLVAFGGRTLTDNPCKYINTAETDLFKKRENLYMYDVACKAPCKAYILCEGYMDVLTMHKYGFINTVASLGTSLTKEQVKLLKNKPRVYIMYDSDEAGIKATKRAIQMLKDNVKVVDLSPAKDPDEFLLSQGKEALIERMKSSVSGTEFLIKNYEETDPAEIFNFILSNTA